MSSAHLELAADARLIIYDSWDGLRNLWKRRNLCWNSAHIGGQSMRSLAERHYANLGATVTAASSRGRRGSHGSHQGMGSICTQGWAWVVASLSQCSAPREATRGHLRGPER